VSRVEGEQPDGPPAFDGNEAGEDGGVDQDAQAGHGDASKGILQPPDHPGTAPRSRERTRIMVQMVAEDLPVRCTLGVHQSVLPQVSEVEPGSSEKC